MNKQTGTIIIIIAMLIIGVAIWFFFFKNSDSPVAVVTNTNTNTSILTDDGLIPESKESIIVFAVSPETGSKEGNIEVTVVGLGFINGAKVFFGNKEASNVSFTELGEIRATIPEGDGLVDVKVVNPDDLSGILYDAFTYN